MRRHLIAIDGKKQASYAFDWYLENVWREGDQVVLVYCSPFELHVGIPGAAVNIELVSKQVKEAKDKADAILQTGNEMLRNRGIKGYTILKTGVKPEEGIINVAAEEEVSHIFMGTRDLNTLQRALVGSVSTYVIRHARVPVTIVKMPQDD